jgi:uncharacterized protein YndB with AHSA1/START domain
MMWVLCIVGVLVGLVVAMAAIGAFMPAAHRVTRSVTLAQSPERVFATVTDVAASPAWRSDLARIEMLPPLAGKKRFREHGKNGKLLMEIDEEVPHRRLVTRIADDALPFGGRWIFEVAPEGSGCKLTITEDGFVKNPVFRFLSRFVFSHTATMEAYLRNLGRHFGETVRPS